MVGGLVAGLVLTGGVSHAPGLDASGTARVHGEVVGSA